MIEANPLKFYVAKYFFLAFAVFQFLASAFIVFEYDLTVTTFFIALLFMAFAVAFMLFYFIISNKIRRVAIGKNKIVVIERDRNIRFSFPDVKSVKVIPVFNLYRLKIRGKRTIYFFPSSNLDPAFGSLVKYSSKESGVSGKRKRLYR
jgi:hypothetical protein